MEIAASVSGNTVIESALRRAHAEVLRGSAIAAALSTGVAFPRLLIRMVSVGETTGRLPEVMEKVSDAYEEQVESAVVMTTALFEPIIIVFFGMIVLTLVLAVYLPVFTAASRM
jgi:type IV pilus assembly protein PilC